MIGLITLGGLAIASTSALVYDWFSEKNEQPAIVINTEKTVTASADEVGKSRLIIAGMVAIGVYVYFKYIRKRR